MKPVKLKYIYGSVKISGPVTDFSHLLCEAMEKFERDAEAFATEHIKELLGKRDKEE